MSTTAAPSVVAEVEQWLSRFDEALTRGDSAAAAELFGQDSYWRDLVAFTWNLTTVEGQAGVRHMLEHALARTRPHHWQTAEEPVAANGVSEAWITFDTAVGRGRGYLRLRDGKAWTLLTTLEELTGHEASAGPHRPKGVEHGAIAERRTWLEERSREREELGYTTQPYVVIVGGGQGGIALGARLRALRVPTIIIERNARPGDSWRNRYKSLCLHDPVWYDHLPYIKFPPNWPVFSPKDKIADWLEMYTRVMELNYWSSTPRPSALATTTSAGSGRTVERDGEEMSCSPNISSWPRACPAAQHAAASRAWTTSGATSTTPPQHPGPDALRGGRRSWYRVKQLRPRHLRRAVGAGADVTMVQRSSTHVVRSDTLMDIALSALYSEEAVAAGMTTEKADLTFASIPYRIMAELQVPRLRADSRPRRRFL